MKRLKFVIPALLFALSFFACSKEEVIVQTSSVTTEKVLSSTQSENTLSRKTTSTANDNNQIQAAVIPPWNYAIQVIGVGNMQQQTLYLREFGTSTFTPVKSFVDVSQGTNKFLFSFDWNIGSYIKIDRNKTYELVSMSGRSVKFNFYSCYPNIAPSSTVPYGNTYVERTWYITSQSFLQYQPVPCANITIQ
jgi:hypothetical protein